MKVEKLEGTFPSVDELVEPDYKLEFIVGDYAYYSARALYNNQIGEVYFKKKKSNRAHYYRQITINDFRENRQKAENGTTV